ncbi:MAG: hypothetical protein FDX30_08495 [Chlorobium sp.]|nr:MAG: hypothetical protein FDX30_08495 [Chlorobium sp.]
MSLIRLKKAEKNPSYRVGINWGELKDRTNEKREISYEHISRNEYDVSSSITERCSEEPAETCLNEYGGMCGFATGVDYIKKHSNIREMLESESKTLFDRLEADELFRRQILSAADMDERMEIIDAYGLHCTKEEAKAQLDKFRDDESPVETQFYTLWGNRVSHVKA